MRKTSGWKILTFTVVSFLSFISTFTSIFYRYDARLLLESLPTASGSSNPPYTPPSPTGWSDLPSDSEDTFFFSPAEIEDFHYEKRRKLVDAGREARLRAMRESDPDPARDFVEAMEQWGGDEEEVQVENWIRILSANFRCSPTVFRER